MSQVNYRGLFPFPVPDAPEIEDPLFISASDAAAFYWLSARLQLRVESSFTLGGVSYEADYTCGNTVNGSIAVCRQSTDGSTSTTLEPNYPTASASSYSGIYWNPPSVPPSPVGMLNETDLISQDYILISSLYGRPVIYDEGVSPSAWVDTYTQLNSIPLVLDLSSGDGRFCPVGYVAMVYSTATLYLRLSATNWRRIAPGPANVIANGNYITNNMGVIDYEGFGAFFACTPSVFRQRSNDPSKFFLMPVWFEASFNAGGLDTFSIGISYNPISTDPVITTIEGDVWQDQSFPLGDPVTVSIGPNGRVKFQYYPFYTYHKIGPDFELWTVESPSLALTPTIAKYWTYDGRYNADTGALIDG